MENHSAEAPTLFMFNPASLKFVYPVINYSVDFQSFWNYRFKGGLA